MASPLWQLGVQVGFSREISLCLTSSISDCKEPSSEVGKDRYRADLWLHAAAPALEAQMCLTKLSHSRFTIFTAGLLLIIYFPPNKELPARYLEINAFYLSSPGRHCFLLTFSTLYSLIKVICPAECCCVCFKLLYLIISFKPSME